MSYINGEKMATMKKFDKRVKNFLAGKEVDVVYNNREEIKKKIFSWSGKDEETGEEVHGKDMYADKLEELYDNEVYHSAAHLIRIVATPLTKFTTLIQEYIGTIKSPLPVASFFPLCYPILVDEKTVNVRVFANIPILIVVNKCVLSKNELEKTTWFRNTHVLALLRETINKDMESPRFKKWETIDRSLSTLRSYQDLSMTKFISTYIKHTLSADKLRDVADSISAGYIPIQVYKATTPREYIDAYETGASSCMTGKDGSKDWSAALNTAIKNKLPEDKWLHPAVWYHYNPQTYLLYTKAGKNVTSRTVVIDNGKDKPVACSNFYSSNSKAMDAIKEYIKENGIVLSGSSTEIQRVCTEEFSTPAFSLGDTLVSPAPYLDHIRRAWNVEYNKKDNCFDWYPVTTGECNCTLGSTQGYYRSRITDNVACVYCGISDTMGSMRVAHDGTVFCSLVCASHNNYVPAYRGDGIVMLVPESDELYKDLFTGKIYIHKRACIEYGAFPIYTAEGTPEKLEDADYSTDNGNLLKYKSTTYVCDKAYLKLLVATYKHTIVCGTVCFETLFNSDNIPTPIVNIIKGNMRLNRETMEISPN